MSRFRYVILPRILLVLSTLALLAALFLLWLSLERPMPTIALACRQAGPANCFTGGEVIASGPIHLNYAETDVDAWAVLRSGDKYAATTLKRTGGVLWTIPWFDLHILSPEEGQALFPCSIALFHHFSYADGSTGSPYVEQEILWETLPLVICTDPSVVTLVGEFLWLGDWEDPREALAQRGASISLSPAGNCVWVGEPVLIPNVPDNPNGSTTASTYSIWLRGYDAAGNLVCSYDPTA
ncbi:hypothetical protein [Flavonifractor sp. HCP28S3_F3]|uniref:hypothetical protein n=1 Tax=Flavonifractor sp. HCP28S3_F3 TaxID=3438939 RepID=UPI003F8BDF49